MKEVNLRPFPPQDILDELTAHAESLVKRQYHQMGYPFDQNVNLSGYYQWLRDTGLCNLTLINVGDPYKTSWDMLETDEFERRSIDFLARSFGFPDDDHWGVLTNGGSDGNMHGIYYGRKYLEDVIRTQNPTENRNSNSTVNPTERPEGNTSENTSENTEKSLNLRPILYVSCEAHYSVRKLGDILQIETRLIDAHPTGQMNTDDFRRKLDPKRPALVAIAIGGTFKGAIDDQDAIESVLEEVRPPAVYRHLDVALFGGYLPWVEDENVRNILNQRLRHFDSLAVSGHKFLAMNEPVGVFICRKDVLNHLHTYSVPYLNGVIPTISCSRSGFDPLKLYWRITMTGPEGFRAETAHILRMTRLLERRLNEIGVKTYVNPYSNTVCMERPAPAVVHKYAMACGDCPHFGPLAHVVVMQFFNEELIEEFVNDIVKSRAK